MNRCVRRGWLPLVFTSAVVSGCGSLLGVGDDVEAPVRSEPEAGTPNEADATTATGEADGAGDGGGDTSDATGADAEAAAPVVKHVFVTRSRWSGAFGSRAAADALCANAAMTAGRGNGTWKAFLADLDGVDPADRIADREWFLYNGTRVFTKGPKTNVNPSSVIAIDEQGLDFGGTADKQVWTGLATAAPANQRTCTGWVSNAGSVFGGYGDMFIAGGIEWRQAGPTAGCDVTYRLYCFED